MVECLPNFHSHGTEQRLSGLVGNNLTCYKQDRCLFQNLSIRLQPGELVHLTGPNGAGKSSLIRILVGLSTPDRGNVKCDGMYTTDPAFAKNILFIGHKAGLNGLLSAEENLTYWCAQHGLNVTGKTIHNTLEMMNLVGLEAVPIKYLSAGQQRRVALARLSLKPATYWILDEPFTSLDTDGIAMMEVALANHVSNNGAVIITSHQSLSGRAGPYRTEQLDYQL
ncbi:cytochrome c biogenesis heme-transporting ATPase CcmA [Alteromonas sp. ASW11-130]|uniref:cytochrome c biogenesis heme-transporting ATPase CcmA n=1 Tax=Alteromonas sp. ASW11-130 TaxID=3015775 RepID=UPI002242B88D|nr:cytochrome c biogenesis heme-transporting ATPase CcmA [Alteromonas sp. ASW11-130]MCW8092823.1 cytochrome c biogenesis heme-transporting ATPase CcmA [Alteromonas sp. ASW11-130]